MVPVRALAVPLSWIVLVAPVLLAPSAGHAFGPRAHALATTEAARVVLPEPDALLPCPSEADRVAFLESVRIALLEAGYSPERADVERRWPSSVAPAFALKGLLDLTRDPRHPVEGLDRVTCAGPAAAVDVLAAAANLPDIDGRNLDRTAWDAEARPIVGTAGPFPEDPLILKMGGMTGLSSQAHAHYALAREGLSGNPAALFTDPQHFALGTPATFGPDQARSHLLLARLAWDRGSPGSRRLALMYLGAALHYVQDAADPLHTVQVGAPCVILPAVTRWVGRIVWTFGGLIGPLPSPVSAGTDPVSNLHLWSESLWDAAVEGWRREAAMAAAGARDAGPASTTPAALWAVADQARPLGPVLYREACDATVPALRRPGTLLADGAFDPAAYRDDAAATDRVLDIGRRSVLLATTASTDVLRAFLAEAAAGPGVIGERAAARTFLDERLRAVRAREDRLADFREAHPEGVPPAGRFRMPIYGVLQALLIAGLAWWGIRKRLGS